VNQQRLFTLGSLYLQDIKKAKVRSFKETRERWSVLHGEYADYLTFEPTEIITDADSERLARLSEIVGIALGMAAMVAEFNVNLNRFNKFMAPGWSKKRVDYEYYSGSLRYFHETKGTTDEQTAFSMRGDIIEKKQDSLSYVARQQLVGDRAQQVSISGCTGSIVLYRHDPKKTFSTQITLIDPPAGEVENTRPASEADELACVLRYYQNFYKVSHPAIQNVPSLTMATWLEEVASGLSLGMATPTAAPRRLRVRPHLAAPDRPNLPYQGTIFDARITWGSVARFPSFEAATAAIPNPVTFLGVSETVTEFIRSCSWTDLLDFHDQAEVVDETAGLDISGSGIMSMRLDPESVNKESKKAFLSMKKVLKVKTNRK
jgi:hypothetical protein